MRTLTSAPRLLAVALIGLGLCASAQAQRPPRPRDPLPERMEPSSTPPAAPGSEVKEGTVSAPSTRLEVPPGTDVKITIEVSSKPNAPPTPPVAAEPPAPAAPDAPSRPRLPLPTIESIQPIPLPPIPDNPPPHEGAMFELPHLAEPPDLVVIEVLEALPGRPISGERLIRPDGRIMLSFYGDIYVRGLTSTQIKEKLILHLRPYIPDEVLGLIEQDENGDWQDVEPKDSNRVFVDVSAYNSKQYFIQGDVASPGMLPCTANETVLQALNYAGGFIPSGDPKNIRLVRPGRDGKPGKVYKVDYEAILERGETEKNYQIFPGDRLIVGRRPVVTTSIELDQMASPMQTVFTSMLTHSAVMKALNQAEGGTAALTAAQRAALVKEWGEIWLKIAERSPGAELDEKTFREALLRSLKPPKAKKAGKKK